MASSGGAAPGRERMYELYGLRLKSGIRLPYLPLHGRARATVRVGVRGARFFSRLRGRARIDEVPGRWFCHGRLPGGGDYLRWAGLFEFVVSPGGRSIAARPLDGASREAFATYLLGQVLSFALVKQGIEPLHATAVVMDGGAVGFLGDCGYGKSTLGAAFLRSGCPVLTDDLLVVAERPDGFLAYPGPPRLKLLPEVADRLLHGLAGSPMNGFTPKLVIPLDRGRAAQGPVPLRALCVLGPPSATLSDPIVIRRFPGRRACIELIRNTFNAMIAEPERLARQLHLAAAVAARVPVLAVSYPRDLAQVPSVVGAIRSRLTPILRGEAERPRWRSRRGRPSPMSGSAAELPGCERGHAGRGS